MMTSEIKVRGEGSGRLRSIKMPLNEHSSPSLNNQDLSGLRETLSDSSIKMVTSGHIQGSSSILPRQVGLAPSGLMETFISSMLSGRKGSFRISVMGLPLDELAHFGLRLRSSGWRGLVQTTLREQGIVTLLIAIIKIMQTLLTWTMLTLTLLIVTLTVTHMGTRTRMFPTVTSIRIIMGIIPITSMVMVMEILTPMMPSKTLMMIPIAILIVMWVIATLLTGTLTRITLTTATLRMSINLTSSVKHDS